MKKKGLIGAILGGIYFGAGWLFFSFLSDPQAPRPRLNKFSRPIDEEELKNLIREYGHELIIFSQDGTKLSCYWLKHVQNDKVFILVHGLGSHKYDFKEGIPFLALDLFFNGYDVFALDLRGHGNSDYRKVTGVFKEKEDVLVAIKYLREYYQKIYLYGVSMGAAACVLAAAESEVDALIVDSCYADLGKVLRRIAGLPYIIFSPLKRIYARVNGFVYKKNAVLKALRKIKAPVLLIHGTLDDVVDIDEAHNLSKACKNKKLVVFMATHARSYILYPDQYVEEILKFVKSI